MWCVWWYDKHNPIWYVIVCYVSEHKHKENLGTFGTVMEKLEASLNRLNAFRAIWDRMGAFGRVGRLGHHTIINGSMNQGYINCKNVPPPPSPTPASVEVPVRGDKYKKVLFNCFFELF